MAETQENDVIRALRERTARGVLTGIEVSTRISGGAPGEQVVDDELRLSGSGEVRARSRATGAMRESATTLAAPLMRDVLSAIAAGADGLIPQSRARFVPDSVVGQITVRIDGQEASFYFLPDGAQAQQHGMVLSIGAAAAVSRLVELHRQTLQ